MTPTSHETAPLRLAVIVGSTRPGRRGDQVASWVHTIATEHLHQRASVDVIDIADYDLPLLDEPDPAALGAHTREHTRIWADAINDVDGFVFVAPEYNHSIPASLKNAIDYLFAEWNNKAAGFVTYGVRGGTLAAEHLRLILAEVKIASVRTTVSLRLNADFDMPDIRAIGTVKPEQFQRATLERLLDELHSWAIALRGVRED